MFSSFNEDEMKEIKDDLELMIFHKWAVNQDSKQDDAETQKDSDAKETKGKKLAEVGHGCGFRGGCGWGFRGCGLPWIPRPWFAGCGCPAWGAGYCGYGGYGAYGAGYPYGGAYAGYGGYSGYVPQYTGQYDAAAYQ